MRYDVALVYQRQQFLCQRRVGVGEPVSDVHHQPHAALTRLAWRGARLPHGHIFQVLTKRPRLTVLARVPARVRFVSAEPLLGAVDLSPWLEAGDVHWVITGGESGRGARPMDPAWALSLRDQCERAGVPFFLKQLGGRRGKRSGDQAELDGRTWTEAPGAVTAGVGAE